MNGRESGTAQASWARTVRAAPDMPMMATASRASQPPSEPEGRIASLGAEAGVDRGPDAGRFGPAVFGGARVELESPACAGGERVGACDLARGVMRHRGQVNAGTR